MIHLLNFFFGWYHGAVWGNIAAELPLAALGVAGFWWHHAVMRRLHEAHDRHLRAILDALDPESDTDTALDRIEAYVDDKRPGGVTAVLDELKRGNR